MTKKQAQERIEHLKKVINYHRYLYHVLDKEEISPEALDSLKKELFDLEQEFPEFITPDSPTQRVEGKPLEKFEKARHPVPMLSINDAFSEKDMEDWIERNSKLLTKEPHGTFQKESLSRSSTQKAAGDQIDFYCELKLDGLAIELIYEKGILKTGSTRGNGIIGEDATQNLKIIEAIPLKLRDKDDVIRDLEAEGLNEIASNLKTLRFPDIELVVRGEVFISKKSFIKVNRHQKKVGAPVYANPRNLAAGSVRQLDPKITAQRRLDSYAYELVTNLGQKTHEEKHKILKILGFKINPHNKFCKDLNEVLEFFRNVQKIRESLAYEIDGIVVNVNSNKIFNKLGGVGKAPRGVIALKFPLKQATTQIQDIRIQVGRTGALTPVAILEPVDVGGVTISRATLHNEDEIKRLDVKIGDTVIVGRAGDVIPDVVRVLPELRTGREKEFKMPKKCPVCNKEVIRLEGEVVLHCINPGCLARKRRYFNYFVSKSAFDIVGLGPKIINQLLDQGLIQDLADLFDLKQGDLMPLERFAEKSARKLIEAIEKSKEISLPKFIYALGIRGVGEETAYDLAENFGNINDLKGASLDELRGIRDIGPVVAQSIYQWFRDKKNLEFSEKLEKVGIKIINQKLAPYRREASGAGLKGKIFVITGTLESVARNEAEVKIRELGGEVSSSVSKNTDYLVIGKNPGSKMEKAKELKLDGAKIKFLTEKQFLKMLKRL